MLPLLSRTILSRNLINRVQSANFRCLCGFNYQLYQSVNVRRNLAIIGVNEGLYSRVFPWQQQGGLVRQTVRLISTSKSVTNTNEIVIEPEPIPYKVVLSGISFTCTKDEIVNFLSGVNITGGTEGIHFNEGADGKTGGTAVVQVDSLKDVERCLSKDGQFIQKRYIEVYRYNDAKFWVYLRGLPNSATEADVLNFLGNVGIEGGKDGIIIIRNWNGKSTGQAYVSLQSKEDINICLERNKKYMGDRYIDVLEVDPLTANTNAAHNFKQNKFWVRIWGLNFHATEADVLKFLGDANVDGGINGVNILKNKKGLKTGLAYVRLQSKFDVELCLAKNKEYMGERYIEVTAADPRTANRIVETSRQNEQQLKEKVTDVVRLKGIPFNCSAKEIREFFEGFDIVESGIIFDDRQKVLPRMFGATVKFASVEKAKEAVTRDRNPIRHRYIRVLPVYKGVEF